jgi:C4-dicarboxylate transporter DctM subunit
VKPEWMPRGAVFTREEKFKALKGAWQIPLLAVLILGAIYSGVCTPTEAAAVGTFMAIVLGIVVVGLKKLRLPQGLRGTITAATMIYAILIGAFMFSSFMSVSRIPTMLAEMIKAAAVSKELVLLIIIIIYTILGMFMSAVAFIVITMPIFFPIVVALGYDPIWYGIIVVKMAGIGMLTPPVGLSVYAVKATVGDTAKLDEIFRGAMLFLIMDFICLFLLILFPWISLVIPNMMGK